MIPPLAARRPDGSVVLSDLAPWFVTVLLELPDLLAAGQPDDVQRRLFPDPGDDPERNEDWERLVRPELFALLASAREILARDLEGLGPQPEEPAPLLWSVTIPPAHLSAWISALNAARLTLGALHDIREEDMDGLPPPEDWGEKQTAVAKIHLYGVMQQMLLEVDAEGGRPQPGYPPTGV